VKKALPIAILLALALAVGGYVAYNRTPRNDTPSAQASHSAATPQEDGQDKTAPANTEVRSLEASLNNGDGSAQLAALAPTLREAYKGAGQTRVVPKGAALKFKPGTFTAAGDMANVDATVSAPGEPDTTIVLVLFRDGTGQPWKVLDIQDKK